MIPFSARNLSFFLSLSLLVSKAFGGDLSQCTNWGWRFGWLVATCPNDANPPVLIESSLYLNQMVSVNNESQLIWSKLGGVDKHCAYLDLQGRSVTGECALPGTNGTQFIKSTLDLSTHIANLNGFLVSNFSKPGVAPSVSSPVPVPLFFQVGIYLERSPCKPPWTPIDIESPINCWSYATLNSTGNENMGWSMGQNDGYEVLLWHSDDCSGKPITTLGMNDTIKYCQMLPEQVRSLSVRPLFNADYDVELADGRSFRRGNKCALGEC